MTARKSHPFLLAIHLSFDFQEKTGSHKANHKSDHYVPPR